jgi:hypothetical protein
VATGTPDIAAAERRKRFLKGAIENGQNFNQELTQAYESFSQEDQKMVREGMVFARFARAARMGIDPLDYENMRPPFPDVRIVINNGPTLL